MSMLSMQYAGTLLGREAVIEFPDSRAEVRYTVKGQMRWRVVDSQGHVAEGCEQLSYLQLSDHLHFLNWIEKTGFTVSQVIDTAKGTVQAFWSYADAQCETGHRSSMFVEGRFRLR
ncbi:MAG: hypothetical protein JO200_06885 [Comamonas sp.]|uniref:MoaF-like domain-containing protein n=1 Tax=Comamonas guangdongensis TaxID=510515 RepID=A0ABV4A0B1_9BURK|nr:hypothetical protein [Comamonas sp.]